MLLLKVEVILIVIIHCSLHISGTKHIDMNEDYTLDELQYVYGIPSSRVRRDTSLSSSDSTTVNCSFPVDGTGVAGSCSISLNVAQHNVSNWRTGTSSGAYWLGGPVTDAALAEGGGYAFATMSDILHSSSPPTEPLRQREAWFKMPRAQPTQPTGRCLAFQYAVDGLSVERLEVFIMSYLDEEEPQDNSSLPIEEPKYEITTLWTDHDATQGDWKQASLSFTAMSEHSIIFKTLPNMKYASMKYNGYAAIDDISFTEGPCENECMFDADFCSWNNTEDDDDFDWQLGRSSDQRGTGPSRDQASTRNENILTGGYAYIPSGYPRRPGDSARLQSKEMESGGQPICLSFWINLHGGGIGELRVLKIEDTNASDASTIIWQQKGSDTGSDSWYPCQLTVSSDSSYHVVFEAIVGIPGAGDIALDTVTFTNKPCPSLPNSASSGWGDCTFHQDTCNWSVYNPKDAMLARVRPMTYDPPGHTRNFWSVDHYMKWDIGNYQYKPLEKSLLISPEVPESELPMCLSFWVYMYSHVATVTKLGALAVVLRYHNKNVTIWRLQNYQHSSWTYAQVQLDTSGSPRVAFEGIKGPTVIGKILLDDIAIFSSTCTSEPSIASVEAGDCTFDNAEMCGWVIDLTNSDSTDAVKNWRFADENTYISVVEDNTFGTKEGGYMLIESLNVDLRSVLLSPNLAANSSLCMTFWYTAYYPDSGAKLEIYRRGSSSDQILWSITHDNFPSEPASNNKIVHWNFGQVVLSTQDNEFKVYFQAKVRNSGWALDDIRFLRNTDSCSTRPASAA